MKSVVILTFILISSHLNLAYPRMESKLVSSDLIKIIENKVKIELDQNKDTTPTKRYYIYALAARELMQYGHYKKAIEYYNLSLAQNINNIDKTEAFYNRLYLSYKTKDDIKIQKSFLKELKSYIALKNNKNKRLEKSIKFWDAYLDDTNKVNESVLNSFYGAQYSNKVIKNLIKENKFEQALLLMPTSEKLKNANINEKIKNDILRFLVFKESKKFLCTKMLKDYPKSKTYTMEICRYVNKNGKPSIKDLEDNVKKQAPDKMYLVEALKMRGN